MRTPLVVLLVTLAAAPQAFAEPLTEDVRKYLAAARALHKSLAFEDGLVQVGKAERAAQKPLDDVAVNLMKGVLLRELGRTEEAENAFRTALTLEPLAGLPVVVSPRVKAEFEALRLKLTKRPALPPLDQPAVVAPPAVEAGTKHKRSAVVEDSPASDAPIADRPVETKVEGVSADADVIEEAPPRSTTPNIVAGVSGGLLLLGGGALLVHAATTSAAVRRGDVSLYRSYARAMDAEVGAVLETAVGYPLVLLGGAVLGAALLMWPSSPEDEEGDGISFWLGREQVGACVRGSF